MNISIIGTGRMGQLIRDMALEQGHQVLAMGDVLQPEAVQEAIARTDLLIDFSHPDNLDWVLSLGPVPLVEGTTGFEESHLEKLKLAAQDRPVFFSSNYSVGIALLKKLAAEAAAALPGFDIEIIEKHHNQKADAPSGTALTLLEAVDPDNDYDHVFGRSGRPGPRKKEIGVHAVRGGTLPGNHEVLFLGPDEVVTLSHDAYSRKIFVSGALQAAGWLANKTPGLYSMDDMLEVKK